jgi:hypothetical protein
MGAASVGRQVGEALQKGTVPKEYARFGNTLEEVFADYRIIKELYGKEASSVLPGALGVFSYLRRVTVGMQHFMALNRKFALAHIEREDMVPLTEYAARVTGLATYEELLERN